MKEFFNTLFDTANDRLKNPFIVAFIFSFIAINWRPLIIVLYSDLTILERIEIVTAEYSSIKSTLLFPLGFAAFYVGILPYFMWMFEWMSYKSWVGRKNNRLQQELHSIISKQEIAKEESKLETIRANYRDKSDLNKTIDDLRNQLVHSENENESLINRVSVLSEELDEYYRKNSSILTDNEKQKLNNEYLEFKNSELWDYFKSIGVKISDNYTVPHDMSSIVIDKFRYSGIIKHFSENEYGVKLYEFTKKGNYFWERFIMESPLDEKVRKSLTSTIKPIR